MPERWKSRVVSPKRVMEKIRPGMSIFVGSGAAEPRTLIRHLLSSDRGYLEDLDLIQVLSFGEAVSPEARKARHVRLKTFFSGWLAENAISDGYVDFIPSRFMHIPALVRSGQVHIDVCFVQVTPPNTAGYCSLGPAVDVARDAMEQASLRVAEINPGIPFTQGDTLVSLGEFDLLTVTDLPPLFVERSTPGPVLDRVAFNAAALIEDECCVAFSVGPFFEALAKNLTGKQHLGIHSPFFTDALMDLMKSGAVTNRRKETHRGKALTSYAVGTEALFQWLDQNPFVDFQAIDKVYNPSFIGRNPCFVTIIPVSRVDLYGRICLQAGGSKMVIGSGEVADFFDGAEASVNGRAIFTLPSRDPEGGPNILPTIAAQPNQFNPYESVNTVVTEYGAAHLAGHTVRERAQALIEIAHPDDRQHLVEQAKRVRILYPDQIFIAEGAKLYPSEIDIRKTVKEGIEVRFRPIKPSDEEGMRRLFYRFSDEAVYARYFHSVRAMPHAKMQAYVNVDWNRVMSIVGLVGEEGRGELIAEARYISIPGTRSAEVVFVVDERYQRCGIATEIYRLLVRLAAERGIREFVAEVLFSNSAMMKVFRKGGLPVRAVLEEGTYHIVIPIIEL